MEVSKRGEGAFIVRIMSKDVLLIARPDHSYLIYKGLERSKLSFLYLTFKAFPLWMKKMLFRNNPKVVALDKHYKIVWSLSIVNILRFTLGWRFLSFIKESDLLNSVASKVLRNNDFKIVHYWPLYCLDTISALKKKNPKVYTVADMYMPCEKYILEKYSSYMESLGLEHNFDYIKAGFSNLEQLMQVEDNFFVPSEYVAQTYRKYYPKKNYVVVSYGITIYAQYRKKAFLNSAKPMKFVYVGTISVEKGCDLLLEWFSGQTFHELHLFGKVHYAEVHLFEKYKQNKRIVFHGTVAKSELQDNISQYDVGIHLSRFDAYSLAVGEVIGCGLPVVVSSETGISEEVRKNGWGIVCDIDYPDAITEAIHRISEPQCYNECLRQIDKYITSNPQSYSDCVIDAYWKILRNL